VVVIDDLDELGVTRVAFAPPGARHSVTDNGDGVRIGDTEGVQGEQG
jgi:hypothetical protein